MKLVQASLSARKHLESSFHHCGDDVKLVQACLSTRKDPEICFLHCERPLKLVQAFLNAWKDQQNCGGLLQLMCACLKHPESSFRPIGGPFTLV